MSDPEAKSVIRHRNLGILLVVVLLAVMLRLYRIEDESLWYDEAVSVQYIEAPSFAEFFEQERVLDPAVVPVYFILEYFWWHYVSATEYGLRLLSIGMGLLTVVAVWWLGRNIYSARAGTVAALCAAFAQNQIYYSQEIRMYAPMYLLAALSVLTLERAISRGKPVWWISHWALSALLVWTHLLGTLLLVAQGLAVLWFLRRRIPNFFLWAGAQCLYLLPLVWWMMSFREESLDEHLTWIHALSTWRVLDTFWTVLAGTCLDAREGLLPSGFRAIRSHAIATLLWCSVAWAVWRTALSRRESAHDRALASKAEPGTILLILWCVVPVLMLVVLSLTVRPCYVERYVGHCGLALFVLAGGGIDRLPYRTIRWAVLALLVVGYAVTVLQWPRPLRPNLRAAVGVIERQSDGTEYFYLDNRFESGFAFAYYMDVDASKIFIGDGYLRKAVARAASHQSAWMITVGRDRSIRQFETESRQAGMKVRRYTFPGRRRTNLVHAVPKSPGAGKTRNAR